MNELNKAFIEYLKLLEDALKEHPISTDLYSLLREQADTLNQARNRVLAITNSQSAIITEKKEVICMLHLQFPELKPQ